jgi:hypothetical protein
LYITLCFVTCYLMSNSMKWALTNDENYRYLLIRLVKISEPVLD